MPPECSSEPEKVLAVAQNRSSLLVMWERPRSVYDGAIDRYAVRYRPAGNPASPTIEYLTDGDQDVVRTRVPGPQGLGLIPNVLSLPRGLLELDDPLTHT